MSKVAKAPLRLFRKRLNRAQILALIDDNCEDRPKLIQAMDDDGRKSWSVREIFENYARIYKEYKLEYWMSARWRLLATIDCHGYSLGLVHRRGIELMGFRPEGPTGGSDMLDVILTREQLLGIIDKDCDDRPKLTQAMDDDGRSRWTLREILARYRELYVQYNLKYWHIAIGKLVNLAKRSYDGDDI